MGELPTIDQLEAYFGQIPAAPSAERSFVPNDGESLEEDAAVWDRIFASAAYGAKARDLAEGRWQQHYPQSRGASEADFALVNYLSMNSSNHDQVRRMFNTSALHRAKYSERPSLVDDMITEAFAGKLGVRVWGWDGEIAPDAFADLIAKIKAHVDRAKVTPNGFNAAPIDEVLPIIWAADLAKLPIKPPLWMVADLIPANNVALLYADGGAGKSQLIVQLLLAAAANLPFLKMAVQHGDGFYLTAEEDKDEVHRRLDILAKHMGVSLHELPHRIAISSLADRDALLAVPDGRSGVLAPTALYEAVRVHIETHQPVLTVIDTLADTFGGNENDRGQARQFVGALRQLAIKYQTTIVLIAHPSRDGIATKRGDGGSTAWNNSVRSRLYMTDVEGEPDSRMLSVKKQNYGRKGQHIKLEWRSGIFVAIGGAMDASARKTEQEQSVDDIFMSILTNFAEMDKYVVRIPNSPDYAPKLFAKHPKSMGYTKPQFTDAMTRLFAQHRISDGMIGPYPSKQKKVIVIPATSGSTSGSTSK